jgi:hypothetical protein
MNNKAHHVGHRAPAHPLAKHGGSSATAGTPSHLAASEAGSSGNGGSGGSGSPPKLRILALHGSRQDGAVLAARLKTLIKKLSSIAVSRSKADA